MARKNLFDEFDEQLDVITSLKKLIKKILHFVYLIRSSVH